MSNPLSRREVLRFGAYTTVGGALTPGISMAQAIVTEGKGLSARDVTLTVGGVAHREGGMQGKDFAEMGKIAGSVTRAQYLGDIRAAARTSPGRRPGRARTGSASPASAGAARSRCTSPRSMGVSPRPRRGMATSSGPIGTRPASTPSA
jgi:hypothetical protein